MNRFEGAELTELGPRSLWTVIIEVGSTSAWPMSSEDGCDHLRETITACFSECRPQHSLVGSSAILSLSSLQDRTTVSL